MSLYPEDGTVIAASLSDPAAFAEIFDRHFAAVSAFLRRKAGEATAEEITSQAFLVAFRSRAGHDQTRTSAKPWLLGIATNLLRHQARGAGRQGRAYERLGRSVEPDFSGEAIQRADAESRRPVLVAALAALTNDERDVLLLFAWAELTYEEIGEALEIPLGTVRSRLSRARARMEQLIHDDELACEGVTTRD